MKTLFAIQLLVLGFVLNACDNSAAVADDSSLKARLENSLQGSWTLTHVGGGFAGIDEAIEEGAILWTFNASDSRLLVEKIADPGILYEGLPEGSYTYSVVVNEKGQYLLIGDEEMGGFTVDSTKLVIDQNNRSEGSGADLFILQLMR